MEEVTGVKEERVLEDVILTLPTPPLFVMVLVVLDAEDAAPAAAVVEPLLPPPKSSVYRVANPGLLPTAAADIKGVPPAIFILCASTTPLAPSSSSTSLPLMCSINRAFNNSVVARAFAVARLAIVSKFELLFVVMPEEVRIVSLAHSSPSSSLLVMVGLVELLLLEVIVVVISLVL